VRVPLISPMTVVVTQFLPAETCAQDPAGDSTVGYDPDFREPVALQTEGGQPVTDTRQYGDEIKLPCQVEFKTYEELQMVEQGDNGISKVALVLHRRDLLRLGLIDDNGNIKLKKGDKIIRFEKAGRTTLVPNATLYFYRIDPASQGFGPDGYDLHIVWTSDRTSSVYGR